MRAFSIVLGVLAACGTREPGVATPVVKPAPPVPAAVERIELDEIVITPRMDWWKSAFARVPLEEDSFELVVAAKLTRARVAGLPRLLASHVKLRRQLLGVERETTRLYAQLESKVVDRAGIGYNQQLAKIQEWHELASVRAIDELHTTDTQLLALLETHRDQLTSDGALLRMYLLITDAERRDTSLDGARAASDSLGQAPGAADRADVSYLRAYLRSRSETPDEQRVAATEFLELVRRFPHSPHVEVSYRRAADLSFSDSSSAAVPQAISSYRWLVANGSNHVIRREATYRLALAYELTSDRTLARSTFCGLIDDPATPKTMAVHAAHHLSQDLVDDVEPLAVACAARRCPCRDVVFEVLALPLWPDSGAPERGKILELALAHFPLSPSAGARACELVQHHDVAGESDRASQLHATLANSYGPSSAWAAFNPGVWVPRCQRATAIARNAPHVAVEHARDYLRRNKPLRDCLVAQVAYVSAGDALDVELDVAANGFVESARSKSTATPTLLTCSEAVLRRHRWRGLDRKTVVVRLLFDPRQ